jgi:hypothetical protein
VASCYAAGPTLFGLIGNAVGTELSLVNLNPLTGQIKTIRTLDWIEVGGLAMFKVDFPSNLFYMGTISMTNNSFYLFKMDNKGNLKAMITTQKPITSLEWDRDSGSFYAETVDLATSSRNNDIATIDFESKVITDTYLFPDHIQTVGVGVSFYVQSNHTMAVVTETMFGEDKSLVFVDTQSWSIVAKYPWNYQWSFAMVFDEETSTVIHLTFNFKTNGSNIISVELPSLKTTVLYSIKNYCCSAGANLFDPNTGNYYVAVRDFDFNSAIVTFNTKTKKAHVQATDFFPFAFVVAPSGEDFESAIEEN